MEESIYNLIPPSPPVFKKGKMYRSSFPHNIVPTGSTFGVKSSVISVKNVSGLYQDNNLRYTSECGTIGKPKTQKLSPIRVKIMGTNSLDAWMQKGSIFKSQTSVSPDKKKKLKPLVPRKEEKPILNLKSKKNFIASNAIEVVLSSPKVEEKQKSWLQKDDYGQIPLYLSQIKDQLHQSYIEEQEYKRKEEELRDSQIQLMNEEELQNLREGLKKRYDEVNQKYQLQAHQKIFDTVGMKRRKEMYEKELTQLEKDMGKINKGYVFIQKQ